jgi:hypothetical protein
MFCVPSCRIVMLATVWLCVLSSGGTAHAFSDPKYYYKDPTSGGGGGRWFTGSPADGNDCSVCHDGGKSWPLYVTGLPSGGYVPGTVYDLSLSWPEFTAHRAQVMQANPAAVPTMQLVTELVAESGKGFGTLAILDVRQMSPAEKCNPVRPLLPATNMWTVKPGVPTTDDSSIRLTCQADDFNERCLITTEGCGAELTKMKWTAPATWQGNIWFNAGFVASDDTVGFPNVADGVTALSIPLAPAASSTAGYVDELKSGCSVSGVGRFGGAGWLAWTCALAVLRSLRRRARKERS